MDGHTRRVGRRTYLMAVIGASSAAFAGCLGDDADIDPVAIGEGDTCDNCDMVIEVHPGPVGQAMYEDDRPEELSEDGPATFCSAWCLYDYTFRQADLAGVEPTSAFATDYSAVEYELTTDDGAPTISAHLEAGDFASVDGLRFVVDSEVEGAMGGSLIGFSDAADADAFADEHGGEVFTDDELTRELIQAL